MEIERRAEMQRANCGWAGCDWLRPRPRLMWLDMGIYWRQLHQSAPHLINEPEHCKDQELYTSELFVVSWSKLQQVSEGHIFVLLFFSLYDQCALLQHWKKKRCAVFEIIRTLQCVYFLFQRLCLEFKQDGTVEFAGSALTFCFRLIAGTTEEKERRVVQGFLFMT